MEKTQKFLELSHDVISITESWQEIPFEELEERLELVKCDKFTCGRHKKSSNS